MARTSKKYDREKVMQDFRKGMKVFTEAVSEILADPELRTKAKEFSKSLVDAAAKVVESRIEDAEIKTKFNQVGKAAKSFGDSLTEHFD
jgi:soluble cytochrome b562